MRILFVEDETVTAEMLAKGLREQSYAVDLASDGAMALEKAATNQYDLILLDVMLPVLSGFEVCHRLRAAGSAVPVLMVTALDRVTDRIRGLDDGADDYISKPFDFGELLARVRALLRRGPRLIDPLLVIDNLQIDTRTHKVQRNRQAVELTAKEYALLECLARDAGRVLGRSEISERVWDEYYDPFSNLIEVYIQRLRRKVDLPGEQSLIHTKRGEGYCLAVQADAVS